MTHVKPEQLSPDCHETNLNAHEDNSLTGNGDRAIPFSNAHTLSTSIINGISVTINVLSDDHSDMELAYRLWYDVYITELNYPLMAGVDHEQKTLRLPPNGSIVFLAMVNNTCVGTLRATYEQYSKLDFEYHQWLPSQKVGELSKLIANKKFRKTELAAQILIACFNYNKNTGKENLYDIVVINSTPRLLKYYSLFGFSKVSEELVIHPDIRNKGYLLKCSKEKNQLVVMELKQIISGNLWLKTKWTIKYWLSKHFDN